MRLGFLGAGAISDAVIRGLCRDSFGCAERLDIEVIFVSKRNAGIAAKLAQDFSKVKIAATNQILADSADIVFVSLPGAVCEQELRSLRFKPGQKLVSFVPSPSRAALAAWTGGEIPVIRAVPLPFIAEHKIATPIFPADDDAQALFAAAGGFIAAENEAQFNLFMTAGSMMGVYYRFCGICADWLGEKGLPAAPAQLYMAQLFAALSEQACQSGGDSAAAAKDYPALQREYSTKGGTNELIAAAFDAHGGAEALRAALESGLKRIKR